MNKVQEDFNQRLIEQFGDSDKLELELKDYENRKETDKVRLELGLCYEKIVEILKKYCDIPEEHYSLIALWIIGSHIHKEFDTYPYLFINAMRGSGKSRLLRLIVHLCKGEMLNSLTEAVLFRTKGMIGIDEFEGISRKGNEALRELLNSAYKKGIKVRRMRKAKTILGEEQTVEEFEPYRPIVMANIWGLEEVLQDRCLTIILDKSNRPEIVKLMEDFDYDKDIAQIMPQLFGFKCMKCSVCRSENIYLGWNSYILGKYTSHTLPTLHTHTTLPTLPTLTTPTTLKEENFFRKLDGAEINGRHLELTYPLLFLANFLNEELFDVTLQTVKKIVEEKRSEDIVENKDVSLIDFVAQYPNQFFIPIKHLIIEFKEYLQDNGDWLTPEWMGRALKRLNLISEKRRIARGVEVRLDIDRAIEKLKIFQLK